MIKRHIKTIIILLFSILCGFLSYKFVNDGTHYGLSIAMAIVLYLGNKMESDGGDSSKHGENSSF